VKADPKWLIIRPNLLFSKPYAIVAALGDA